MKASIFYRNDHTNKDGSIVIYLRVIIDRKKKDYSLKIAVLPEFWEWINGRNKIFSTKCFPTENHK